MFGLNCISSLQDLFKKGNTFLLPIYCPYWDIILVEYKKRIMIKSRKDVTDSLFHLPVAACNN
jgi:hypothetical protein